MNVGCYFFPERDQLVFFTVPFAVLSRRKADPMRDNMEDFC